MTSRRSLPGRLRLLFGTARYLDAQQIRSRLGHLTRKKWRALTGARVAQVDPPPFAPFAPLWAGLVHGDAADAGRAVAEGRFTFLNREVVYRDEPRWDDPAVSQLWRYHLQYFDYLRDLAVLAAQGERVIARDALQRLVRSWIPHHQRLTGDGWHPYTVSLRIVNWIEALRAFGGDLDPAFEREMRAILYAQAGFLARNLETDVRGNHLLKNLRALIWAGVAFENSWRDEGLRRLESEVAEQVLADGGHFERAPGYHRQVLADLFETEAFLARNGGAPFWLSDAVARMFVYLRTILTDNGRLPLLKDTALDETPHAVDLLDPASPYRKLIGDARPTPAQKPASVHLPDSGYAVIRDDTSGDHLIVDVGRVCPDYLPAHAHADMLSFELTIGGVPVVVDSGVFEYAAGQWRDWFRSTAAHNTVEVEGTNQSEVWASFRVARRARIRNVRSLSNGIQAEHDGYERLAVPVTHRRTVVAFPERVWLIADELFGKGVTRAASYVHLHPRHGSSARVIPFGGEAATERGWYSEEFGVKEENDVVAIRVAGELPMCFGYVIAPAGTDVRVTLERVNGVPVVRLHVSGRVRGAHLPRHSAPLLE